MEIDLPTDAEEGLAPAEKRVAVGLPVTATDDELRAAQRRAMVGLPVAVSEEDVAAAYKRAVRSQCHLVRYL